MTSFIEQRLTMAAILKDLVALDKPWLCRDIIKSMICCSITLGSCFRRSSTSAICKCSMYFLRIWAYCRLDSGDDMELTKFWYPRPDNTTSLLSLKLASQWKERRR